MGKFVNNKKNNSNLVHIESVDPQDENQEFDGILVGNGLYREVTLHEYDAGKSVDVKHFGEVIISLEEILADGCKWLVDDIGSMRVFDESKKSVEQGVSQERVFRLEPKELGEIEISFKYVNPWKDESEVKNSVKFTVVSK